MIHIYIISVPTATDRRAHVYEIESKLCSAGVKVYIIDGYSYKNMDVMKLLETTGLTYTAPNYCVSLSQVGCALSHRHVWSRIAEAGSDDDIHIVLEDDMDICDNFSIESIVSTVEHAPDYDVVYLWKHPHQAYMQAIHPYNNYVSTFYNTWGACAYAMTPKAAQQILQTLKTIDAPIDDLLVRDYYPHMKVFISLKDHFVNKGDLGTHNTMPPIFKSLIWA